jgi:hypothetical protein
VGCFSKQPTTEQRSVVRLQQLLTGVSQLKLPALRCLFSKPRDKTNQQDKGETHRN